MYTFPCVESHGAKIIEKKCVYFSESCLTDQCQPTAIILFAFILGNNQSLALQAKKKIKS